MTAIYGTFLLLYRLLSCSFAFVSFFAKRENRKNRPISSSTTTHRCKQKKCSARIEGNQISLRSSFDESRAKNKNSKHRSKPTHNTIFPYSLAHTFNRNRSFAMLEEKWRNSHGAISMASFVDRKTLSMIAWSNAIHAISRSSSLPLTTFIVFRFLRDFQRKRLIFVCLSVCLFFDFQLILLSVCCKV